MQSIVFQVVAVEALREGHSTVRYRNEDEFSTESGWVAMCFTPASNASKCTHTHTLAQLLDWTFPMYSDSWFNKCVCMCGIKNVRVDIWMDGWLVTWIDNSVAKCHSSVRRQVRKYVQEVELWRHMNKAHTDTSVHTHTYTRLQRHILITEYQVAKYESCLFCMWVMMFGNQATYRYQDCHRFKMNSGEWTKWKSFITKCSQTLSWGNLKC